MRTEDTEQELRSLIGAWCEDTITDEEVRRLNWILLGNEVAQQLFAELTSLNAILEQLGPETAAGNVVPIGLDQEPPKTKKTFRWNYQPTFFELAALLIAMAALCWAILDQGPTTDELVESSENQETEADGGYALLTHSIAAKWAEGADPVRPGSIVGKGNLKLESGWLHLQFYNGVKVVLEGPADFEILSMEESFCWQGRVHASVPPHAQGFVVHTPTGELVDHGTDFGVEVNSDGSSEIHVFDGEVVFRNPHQETVAQLTPGNAAHIDEFGRPLPLLADPDAFASNTEIMQWHSDEMARQLARWYHTSVRWRDDARVLAFYDFDTQDFLTGVLPATTKNPWAAGQDGVIIGAESTDGRWPGKGALEFSRPADRVRVRIPGYHDALTLSAWVRIDQIDHRPHGLLVSDGFDHGALHWQFHGGTGELMLSTRREENERADYRSPSVINASHLGEWVHLACVYDRIGGFVAHYFNGLEVSREALDVDVRLRAGIAEIANWGAPSDSDHHPVRNFIGVIDEFAVYGDVLQPEEIASIFETGFPR